MSLRRWSDVALLVSALALAVMTGTARAAALPSQTIRDIARDLHLQQVLPGPRLEHARTQQSWHTDLPLGDILAYLAVGAIALGLLFAVYSIRDRLPALGRRKLTAEAEAAQSAASVEKMVASQLEADELAGRGQLTEAMHTLLLRSLIEMRKTLDIGFADSLTSREILNSVTLPELGKGAFGDLIRRVERVYFGDHEASQEDYAACRRSYLDLTASMRAVFAGGFRR